jgi:dTDP-4-amino-4,6-dideoxygalactose transaminase
MKVPFLDLKAQYESIKEEITVSIQQVIDACAFAGGPFVAEFEKAFAAFCQSKYSVGVGSGTEALWLSLLALGIGHGDEVITVPNTFIATAEAISFTGATPVFVDVDERTYTMNPELLEDAITLKTKAIIPVHLFGQMADMDPIMDIAHKHNLFVIEDACQAHGAEYKGKKAGSIGDMGCFSFYPGKNLGAYGEAGAVVTNSADMYKKIGTLRDHGQSSKYYHDEIGWNARMNGIQGAILSVKLKYIDQWNEARRQKAAIYNEHLKNNASVTRPKQESYARHIFHVYAIRIKNRDYLFNKLKDQEISCGIHYPIPIHLQKAYHCLDYKKSDFPISERCSEEFISLPMYPELKQEQIDFVVNAINEVLEE